MARDAYAWRSARDLRRTSRAVRWVERQRRSYNRRRTQRGRVSSFAMRGKGGDDTESSNLHVVLAEDLLPSTNCGRDEQTALAQVWGFDEQDNFNPKAEFVTVTNRFDNLFINKGSQVITALVEGENRPVEWDFTDCPVTSLELVDCELNGVKAFKCYTLTIAGVTNNACSTCTQFNGTHQISYQGGADPDASCNTDCTWCNVFPFHCCGNAAFPAMTMEVLANKIVVSFYANTGDCQAVSAQYETADEQVLTNGGSIPKTLDAGDGSCDNWPDSITLAPLPECDYAEGLTCPELRSIFGAVETYTYDMFGVGCGPFEQGDPYPCNVPAATYALQAQPDSCTWDCVPGLGAECIPCPNEITQSGVRFSIMWDSFGYLGQGPGYYVLLLWRAWKVTGIELNTYHWCSDKLVANAMAQPIRMYRGIPGQTPTEDRGECGPIDANGDPLPITATPTTVTLVPQAFGNGGALALSNAPSELQDYGAVPFNGDCNGCS